MSGKINSDHLSGLIGTQVGLSKWLVVDQERIRIFADTTEDWQAIHLDAEAARAAGFSGPVAHGFLTLSLLSTLAYDALPEIETQRSSINYGFDRVRFLAPVPENARIRARFVLEDVGARKGNAQVLGFRATVEIAGQEKPALIAVWRIMYQF